MALVLGTIAAVSDSIGAIFPAAIGHLPDAQVAPLLSSTGETRITLGYGQRGRGARLQSATAVSPTLALLAGGAYSDLKNCESCRISVRRHIELGLGTFRQSESGWVKEAYAGAAAGRFELSGNNSDWDPDSEDLRYTGGHYEQFFLQGNVGRKGKWTDRAASLRLSAYRYHDFFLRNGDGLELPMADSHLGIFAEPAVTWGLGYKSVKLETQLGFSIPILQAAGVDNNKVWMSMQLGLNLFK